MFRVDDSKGDSKTLDVPYIIKVRPDTNSPVQPSSAELTGGNNAVSISSGQLTNNPSPGFKGLTEINSKVDLSLDGDLIGTVIADNSGQWSYTDNSLKLNDGVHKLTVRATDQAGISPLSRNLLLSPWIRVHLESLRLMRHLLWMKIVETIR